MMRNKIRLVIDFLAAVLSCYILASLFHSQFVLYELIKIGAEINFSARLEMSFDDLFGLLPAYGSAITIALLLAFLTVKLIIKFSSKKWQILYPLAGALAMFVTLMAMQPILDITLIAGARTPFGVTMQCVAGLFGGWVFCYQRHRATTR